MSNKIKHISAPTDLNAAEQAIRMQSKVAEESGRLKVAEILEHFAKHIAEAREEKQ